MPGSDSIVFNAVCLGPKFNMTFEKEIWMTNSSVAPGNLYKFTLDFHSTARGPSQCGVSHRSSLQAWLSQCPLFLSDGQRS